MRVKYQKLVGLLMVLAIVCSLVAIIAAPAGAITAGFAVTNTPTTVNVAANYSVGPFTVLPGAGSYQPGTDYFTVTFPAGTTLPALISRTSVTLTAGGGTGYAAYDLVPSGQSVTVYVPTLTVGGAAFGALGNGTGVTIVFLAGAGIKNPATVASTWTLTVAGHYTGGVTGDEAAATSATYSTTVPVTTVTLSPNLGPRSTQFTLNATGFTPSTVASITVGSTIMAYGSVDASGNVGGTYTASVPPFAAGANTVTVTDGAGKTGSAVFTVNMGITLNPTSARSGDTLTIIGTDTGAVNANSTTIGGLSTTHAAQLAGWTSFTVTIPGALAPGTVVVAVTSGTTTATGNLLIQGQPVTLTPSSGSQGTRVTVQGQGFTPGATATIQFGSTTWATGVAVDTSGNILSVQTLGATQQALGPGTWVVTVTDNAAVPRMGIAYYTIPARTLTLSPTSSGAGSSVLATGAGYSPGVMYSVTYGTTVVVSGMTDGVGGFTAQFAVPINALPNSTNTVTATDANGLAKTATHSVPASAVTISPTSGAAGTSVAITLTGFPAYTTVTQVMMGTAIVTPSPAPYTGATGTVTFNVMVPALPVGPVLVAVTAGQTGSTSFSVTAAPPSVATALSNISTHVVRVWGYINGEWKLYDPADPAGSSLASLTSGNGYWIKVDADCTLIYGSFNKALTTGWNLIGWP
jgi:hypothetical protein